MKKTFKSILSVMLVISMIMGMCSICTVSAAEDTQTYAEDRDTPNADVSILKPLTLTAAEHNYMVWPSGDSTVDRPLQMVMNFKANETMEEAAAGPFADFKCDFYLTFTGLENGSIIADDCYLAGNYGSFGWIVIPADGLELENGVEYPVMAAYDANLKYAQDICGSVKDFTAAIYVAPAILEANPDFTVSLALKMTNPEDENDVITVGEPAVFNATALSLSADVPAVENDGLANAANAGVIEDARADLLALGVDADDVANATATIDITIASTPDENGKIVYNVAPTLAAGGKSVKMSSFAEALTFRLPVLATETKTVANVYHDDALMGTYNIAEENGQKFVEVSSDSFSEYTVEPIEADADAYVAKIGDTGYATLADAIMKAVDGDTITVIADIYDEDVTVTESVIITGTATLENVSISGTNGISLTVENLNFIGDSWINSNGAASLTVRGVTAEYVTPICTTATNSRSAFIALGRSEQAPLALTVENCNISTYISGVDAILGWAAITEANIIGNTFGTEEDPFDGGDVVKFMSIADGAVINIEKNYVYSDYNGIVFSQNTTRDNAYTVNVDGNTFVGSADHIWIEVPGATTCHAAVNVTSDNTVNGEVFAADDIKASSSITTWTAYTGVDVVLDEDGKVIGGTFTNIADDAIADGYEIDENGTIVGETNFVAEVGGEKFESVLSALTYALKNQKPELKLLADSREVMTSDFDIKLDANLTITADKPVTAAFYNDGTERDFAIGANDKYTLTIEENVTFDLEDRVIWVGYWLDNNCTVVVNGTLTCSNLWIGTKTIVNETGKLISAKNELVIRNDADLVVNGGTVDANYFQIYSGHIEATNGAEIISHGPVNVNGGHSYSKEGDFSISLDDATFTSGGAFNIVVADTWETADITLANGSTIDTEGTFDIPADVNVTVDATSSVTDAQGEVDFTPVTATIGASQINNLDPAETFISCEISGLDKAPADNEIEIWTYSGETIIAKTRCEKPEYYALATLTVKICTTGDSGSWETTWEKDMPRADFVPTKNVLYVDKKPVSEAEIRMIAVSGEAKIEWADVSGVNPAPIEPAGKLNKAYTSVSYVNGVPAIFGEATDVVAAESFKVELYAGETLVGYVKLNDPKNEVIGKASSITWHAALSDDGDGYWVPTWEGGALNVNAIPDTAKLYVDGKPVDTCAIELNINDLNKPIFAAVTDENGKIESFVAGSGYLNGSGSNVPVYADALNTALNTEGNDTVVLLRDINTTRITIDKYDVTLDLNGKEITGDGEDYIFFVNNVEAEIKNGDLDGYKIISVGSKAKVTVTDVDMTAGTFGVQVYGAEFVIGGNSSITATTATDSTANCIRIYGTNNDYVTKVTVNGGTYTSNYITIAGNGSYDGTEITINGGELKTNHDTCSVIYQPQYGTLTVNGGTFEGPNAIYVKSGNLEITDGTFTATGENKGYESVMSGTAETGDAVTIETVGNAGYQAVGTVSITGGTFTSKNGEAVASYADTTTNPEAQVVTGFISGGTFSSDVSALCADGFELKENGDGTFGVVEAASGDVAVIGEGDSARYYASLADAAKDATNGDTITLIADAYIAEGTDVTIPDGVTLNGNGFSILSSGADHDTTTSYGYVVAGGNLTIEGVTTIEKFSASHYNHIITIGEGASLQVTGKNRVSLGYGSSFDVTGTITDAKTADKSTIIPSLVVNEGFSIVGADDTYLNVTNAYVKIGSTTSKNSNAGGEFDISFTNSIVEFTNQFTTSTPKYDTLNPVFNVTFEDSVVTAATKLCLMAPGSNVVVDNSSVTLGTYLHNSGTITVQNNSTFVGSMIQYGENGGNSGTITVDNSSFTIKNNNAAYAMDGNNTGKLVLLNNATASVDYITETAITLGVGSSLTSKSTELEVETDPNYEVEYADGKYVAVKSPAVKLTDANGNVTPYDSFAEAYNDAVNGDTITLYEDVYLTGKFTIAKEITIDGNDHSIIADADAVWYTVSGKFNIKNYNKHLIGVNANNVTLKDITLDCNDNAAGINIYCAQNVVFDNVAIINATKGFAALTVNGSTLTVKNAFTATGNMIAMDISNGEDVTSDLGVTVEEGTVLDLADKTVKFISVAELDMTGAVNAEGEPYFAAKDNAYLYTENQMNSRTTDYRNGITLLADVTLNKNLKLNGGTLDLNGNDLTLADGYVVEISGNVTIAGEGNLDAAVTLTDESATLTAPENVNVTSPEGNVVYKDGVYVVFKFIEFDGTTMTLGASLSLDFAIDTANLDGTDNYAVFTHVYADGKTETVTVPQSEWTVYSGTLYTIHFNGLAAKQMNDNVTVTVYNAADEAVSVAFTDSIIAYATRMLNSDEVKANAELITVYVDMLNYGAAAQEQFGYDTENLANRNLTEEQKAYATTVVETTDNRVKGTGYVGSSLTLESVIELDFIFADKTIGSDYSTLYAIVTYTDHYENAHEVRIEGTDFIEYSTTLCQIAVTGMAVADFRSVVSCTVYNADGVELASASDSVESYANRNAASLGATVDTIVKFGASSYNYFH